MRALLLCFVAAALVAVPFLRLAANAQQTGERQLVAGGTRFIPADYYVTGSTGFTVADSTVPPKKPKCGGSEWMLLAA